MILSAEQVATEREAADLDSRAGSPVGAALLRVAYSHDTLRARLRDAEETLRYYARTEGHPISGAKGWDSGQVARAYFERHADPQEPA